MEWLAVHGRRAALCVLNSVGHFPFVDAREAVVEAVAGFVRGSSAARFDRSWIA